MKLEDVCRSGSITKRKLAKRYVPVFSIVSPLLQDAEDPSVKAAGKPKDTEVSSLPFLPIYSTA